MVHLQPPVVTFHDLYCPINAWVSVYWWIMVCLDDFVFALYIVCDNYAPFLIPCVIQTFELMWINPQFKALFILSVLLFDCCNGSYKHVLGQHNHIGIIFNTLVIVRPPR
jgi:hypothetical protein